MIVLILAIVIALAICATLGPRRLSVIGGYVAWAFTICAVTGIVFVLAQIR